VPGDRHGGMAVMGWQVVRQAVAPDGGFIDDMQ
jgi:hypothetical protein